jgi:phage/plasmid-associated DNA primase
MYYFDYKLQDMKNDITDYMNDAISKENSKHHPNAFVISEASTKRKYVSKIEESDIESARKIITSSGTFEAQVAELENSDLIKKRLFSIANNTNDVILAKIISVLIPFIYVPNIGKLLRYISGRYVQADETDIGNIVLKVVGHSKKKSNVTEVFENLTFTNRLSIVEQDKFCNYPNIINTKRFAIEFDKSYIKNRNPEYKIIEHSPSILTTIQFDVDTTTEDMELSQKDIESKIPSYINFLNTSLNDDKERTLIKEWSAYSLIYALPVHRFMAWYGRGGGGKGTHDNLMKSIHRHSSIEVDGDIMTDRNKRDKFYGFQFLHKTYASSTEINKNIKDWTFVKKATGGGRMNPERKGKEETADIEFVGKLNISLNEHAQVVDTTNAIKRRLIFMHMNNKFEKEDESLGTKLEHEKKYIFALFLKSLKMLIKNGFEFTLPQSHFDLMEKYVEDNNNFVSFIRKHIVSDGTGIVLAKDMFELFNEEFGNIYKNKIKTFKELEKTLIELDIKFSKSIKRVNEIRTLARSQGMCYCGISYVDEKECMAEGECEDMYTIDERAGIEICDVNAESICTEIGKILDKAKILDDTERTKTYDLVYNLIHKKKKTDNLNIDFFQENITAKQTSTF